MSNVSSREKTIRVIEVTVPNPANRRDLSDLIMFADRKFRDATGYPQEAIPPDDAYGIEARDEEIVAVIKWSES